MEIKVPEVGESVHEAEIAKWHKKDGDRVEKDDLLCELETDKITLELNADAAGVLEIKTGEGETVEVGAVIGAIEEEAAKEERPGEKEEEKQEERKEEEPRRKKEETAEKRKTREPEEKKAGKEGEESREAGKEEAAEKPEKERESKGERKAEESPARTGVRRDEERVTRTPMSRIRRRIAERMVAARRETAMLTTFNEADMSRVIDLRRRHKEEFHRKHGVALGFMSFFVKAVVEALKEIPEVNARIDGSDIVHQHFYHIGIAIGAEKGLVVPVIRDADRLHFAEIEEAIGVFAEKARTNKLDLADLEGGTFTISNGGIYGSLLSTPLLNPPQSGILGMHAIQDRPVARDGKVVIRPMMNLALTYDHRIVDGREAVGFLKRVRDLIEQPEEMLLDL